MGGDGLVLEVKGEMVVGLEGDLFSNGPRGDGIGIAIEVNAEVGVGLE
jgi:hypothetical protein